MHGQIIIKYMCFEQAVSNPIAKASLYDAYTNKNNIIVGPIVPQTNN